MISTTLIGDFHRCVCYLMRLDYKHISVCMNEDLGVFVMHNDINVADIKQYCISPLPAPLISTLRICYGAAK